MSRAERHTQAAREVAAWLDEQGEHFRANAVRAICRSLSTARVTMAALHRDNADLRRVETRADSAHEGDRS